MNKNIQIYTDGAARGNPGKAGWAAVILLGQNSGQSEVLVEIGGKSDHATNNQMELTAPIEALKFILSKDSLGLYEIEIFSDSKYVILGITEWIANWKKNNWRNAAKKPVLNKELWEKLDLIVSEVSKKIKIKWTYVEGHAGILYNERADLIATSFADDEDIELIKNL
jgi:ribonuclease HI